MGLLSAVRAGALLGAALVAVLSAPAEAAGPSLGLRLAWAGPVGSAAGHVPLSEEVAWQVPIQLDAIWTFPPSSGRFGAGLYGSWAPARAGTAACADGASCSAQALRAGAQGLWTFYRAAPVSGRWYGGFAAWGGVGAGWEWASHARTRLDATTTTGWNGPELSIQGGVEWRLGLFTVGPFALVGVGRYSNVSIDTPVESGSASIGDRAVHAWIHLGVRGTITRPP